MFCFLGRKFKKGKMLIMKMLFKRFLGVSLLCLFPIQLGYTGNYDDQEIVKFLDIIGIPGSPYDNYMHLRKKDSGCQCLNHFIKLNIDDERYIFINDITEKGDLLNSIRIVDTKTFSNETIRVRGNNLNLLELETNSLNKKFWLGYQFSKGIISGQSFIIGPKRAGYGIIYDLEADIKYNDIKANILKAIDFMNGNIIVKTIYLNRCNGEIIAFDDRNKTKKLVWNNEKSDFIESLYYE